VIGGLMTLWGYTSSALRGAKRYDDVAFRRFVRRYQHDCLRLGKAGATRKCNEQQASVWQAAHPLGENRS
jgi:biofilm PGA synthesis N-glycosyltransferase PgaC